MRDLASYRDEFEVVRRKAYLISASLGPVGDRSRAYLDDYLRAWAEKGAPDHVWFEDIFPAMARLKASFAQLSGADPDELAITTNISIAISTVASCLDLSGERNRVLLSELDFPTDGHVWQAWAAKTGAELVWLRSPDGRTLPLEVFDEAIDERAALVMVNRVLYRSSAVVDAKAVCALARERGALSFVDDYHGIGVVPLDVHDLGCDLYASGTLKFLCGGPGCVFLFARRELLPSLEPAVTGWFAMEEPFSFDTEHLRYHPTARRLEHGTP
ncbi:MAG TPA: aminotransferase class V-fold PLP-dependent enzyme, partial [Actinomycetota bacterium]